MKPFLKTFLALVACGLLFAPVANGGSAERVARFHVKGMVCESCARDITEGLSKVRGIATLSVDVSKALATVRYRPGKVAPKDIVKALDDYGFEARELRP